MAYDTGGYTDTDVEELKTILLAFARRMHPKASEEAKTLLARLLALRVAESLKHEA